MVVPVFFGGDEVSALVLDIGTCNTRAGYAGEDLPKSIIPTSYATIPPTSDFPLQTYYHGPSGPVIWRSPEQVVENIVQDGCVVDWDGCSRLTDVVFGNGWGGGAGKKKTALGMGGGNGGGLGVGRNRKIIRDERVREKEWRAFSSRKGKGKAKEGQTGEDTDMDVDENGLEEGTNDEEIEDSLGLDEHPLLVSEASWTPKEGRERMIELAFEELNTQAYYSVDKSVLTAFASGKGTALVVDIGESSTSVVPIYDGFVLRKGIQKQPIAGETITSILLNSARKPASNASSDRNPSLLGTPFDIVPHYLIKSKPTSPPAPGNPPVGVALREDRSPSSLAKNAKEGSTVSFAEYQESRLFENFKESTCEILYRDKVGWDEHDLRQRPTKHFEFPNGFNGFFGPSRFQIPEVLFNPQTHLPQWLSELPIQDSPATIKSKPYSACKGIHEMCADAVNQCDPDIRTSLLSNVVLTGGTTLMQGFDARFQFELQQLIKDTKIRVHAPGPSVERKFAPWLGGSILASLGTFHQLWIGKDEYMEYGRAVVHKRAK